MAQIVYYVAATVDGFISAEDGGIDGFTDDPEFVEHYQSALQAFGTTVMGRATYEFGYRYGLPPGARAYPHMEHYIFSRSLQLPDDAEVTVVREGWRDRLVALKATASTDIYLCGGSEFAGFVLDRGLLDRLVVKVNPFLLGRGKPLFRSDTPARLELTDSKRFACGVVENHYTVLRSSRPS